MIKKIMIMIFLNTFFLQAYAVDDFKGIEWLEKNKDSEGCIQLNKLIEELQKDKSCPKEMRPQVRPMRIGKINLEKTKLKKLKGIDVCCFDWEILGNR